MILSDAYRKQQHDAIMMDPPIDPTIQAARRSAELLLERIEAWAISIGRPLSAWDSWALRSSIFTISAQAEVTGYPEPALERATIELNIRVIQYVRSAIDFEKQLEGTVCIQATSILRVPAFWEVHYEYVFESELDWYLSAVMQNAFLGNPFANEREHWKSPHGVTIG